MDCEFCTELQKHSSSRYGRLYKGLASCRIVAEHGPFIAMPTIGQLLPHSLLVLPRQHVETLASLSIIEVEELSELVSELSKNGVNDYVLFEHGCKCGTGSGCGIYHAHLHFVPIPNEMPADKLLPIDSTLADFHCATSIIEALHSLRFVDEYLLVRDTSGFIRYAIPYNAGAYPSQFFRQRLTECLALNVDWDWRQYTKPENALLNTLRLYGKLHAA